MRESRTRITKLKSVQDYIQRMADAFAAVLDFEVAIVDEALEVIAGTGKYKDQIGVIYGSGSLSYQIICTQKSLLVSEPIKSSMCQKCDTKKT